MNDTNFLAKETMGSTRHVTELKNSTLG